MYTFPYEEQQKNFPGSVLVFYPYQVSEWIIEYKPLPFTKQRKERKFLVSNLTKKETSFFEVGMDHLIPFNKQPSHLVLPERYEEAERDAVGQEFLKNHYMHRRKVWSYPKMEMTGSFSLYIPYFVYTKTIKGEEKKFIYELFTGNEDALDKYKEIKKFLHGQEVIA
ncbi:hypothetical protein [Planococcus salinus]|uniref:Uncharacterized protein n=1 Tax=Planococcus salinus TaxID=1848460 RepID=A0A3M8P8F6_9BACL|nr:hypothetical protein [Planococcus salinus]RNF39540.1 hypothetical protein EEX84_08680 [Planococcus salinus]